MTQPNPRLVAVGAAHRGRNHTWFIVGYEGEDGAARIDREARDRMLASLEAGHELVLPGGQGYSHD